MPPKAKLTNEELPMDLLQKKLVKYKRKAISLDKQVNEQKIQTSKELETKDQMIEELKAKIVDLECSVVENKVIGGKSSANDEFKSLMERFKEEKKKDLKSYKTLFDTYQTSNKEFSQQIKSLKAEYEEKLVKMKGTLSEHLEKEREAHILIKEKFLTYKKNDQSNDLRVQIQTLKKDLKNISSKDEEMEKKNVSSSDKEALINEIQSLKNVIESLHLQLEVSESLRNNQSYEIAKNSFDSYGEHTRLAELQSQLIKTQGTILEYSYKFIKLDSEKDELYKSLQSAKLEIEKLCADREYQPKANVLVKLTGNSDLTFTELRYEYEYLLKEFNYLKTQFHEVNRDYNHLKKEKFIKEEELLEVKGQIGDYLQLEVERLKTSHKKEMEDAQKKHELVVKRLETENKMLKGAKYEEHEPNDGEEEGKEEGRSSVVVLKLKSEVKKLQEQLKNKDLEKISDLKQLTEKHTQLVKDLKVNYFEMLMKKLDSEKMMKSLNFLNREPEEQSVLDKLLTEPLKKPDATTLVGNTRLASNGTQSGPDKEATIEDPIVKLEGENNEEGSKVNQSDLINANGLAAGKRVLELQETTNRELKRQKQDPISPESSHVIKLSIIQANSNADLIIAPLNSTKSNTAKLIKPRKQFTSLEDCVMLYFEHFTILRSIPFIESQMTTNEEDGSLEKTFCCEFCVVDLFTLKISQDNKCAIVSTVRKHKCDVETLIENNLRLIELLHPPHNEQDFKNKFKEITDKLKNYGSVYLPYVPFLLGIRLPRFKDQYLTSCSYFLKHQHKLFIPDICTRNGSISMDIYHESFEALYAKLMAKVFKTDDLNFIRDLQDISGLGSNLLDRNNIGKQWMELIGAIGKSAKQDLKMLQYNGEQ